jgi:hypothetical protein
MHGHIADYDYGWCNWSDNGDGIDQRIVDWFRAQVEIAMDLYNERIYEADRVNREAEGEKRDRAEFQRLKAKYESTGATVTESGLSTGNKLS